jgi:hypothetical protein
VPVLDWFDSVDINDRLNLIPVNTANITGSTNESIKVELYNSGATQHISPYKEDFKALTSIPPKTLSAANKQCFDATAKRTLFINVPNGETMSKLKLTKVSYSPKVRYTLVSIWRLDEEGYLTSFHRGLCTICDRNGKTVGLIPKTRCSLYKVTHDNYKFANAAEELIGLMDLHSRLGHVSPNMA